MLFFLVNDFLLAMEKGQVSMPILFDLSAAFKSSGNEGLMISSTWLGWAISPCRSILPLQRDSIVPSAAWHHEAFLSRTLPGDNSVLSGRTAVKGMGLQCYGCAGDKG